MKYEVEAIFTNEEIHDLRISVMERIDALNEQGRDAEAKQHLDLWNKLYDLYNGPGKEQK